MCWNVFSDYFLYQHSVQVVNKNVKNLFRVPRTFSFCRGIGRGIEYRFFYTSIVSKFKILVS